MSVDYHWLFKETGQLLDLLVIETKMAILNHLVWLVIDFDNFNYWIKFNQRLIVMQKDLIALLFNFTFIINVAPAPLLLENFSLCMTYTFD